MRVHAEVVGKIDWHGYRLTAYSGAPEDALVVLLSSQNLRDRRVLCFSGQSAREYEFTTDEADYQLIQPLPDGFLLANARQSSAAPNASVYGFDGVLLRSLSLGDGIEDLQTTASGEIWVSYFDEGVSGDTIASAGLVRFDPNGEPTFEFQAGAGLDYISDCYALNVENDQTVWFYYYTPFLLARLREGVIDGAWNPEIHGASAFAVHRTLLVIHAGYDQYDWRILRLDDDSATTLESVEFLDPDGDPLPVRCAKARGRLIWFLQNSTIYRADITQLETLLRL